MVEYNSHRLIHRLIYWQRLRIILQLLLLYQFLNKIKVFEYTEPAVILHSKIVLIDGKYSFIGSVNLNKRSFVHDTENGIMIYDQAFNQKMNSIMDTYKLTSREVTEKQKIALWKKAIIGIFDEEF